MLRKCLSQAGTAYFVLRCELASYKRLDDLISEFTVQHSWTLLVHASSTQTPILLAG